MRFKNLQECYTTLAYDDSVFCFNINTFYYYCSNPQRFYLAWKYNTDGGTSFWTRKRHACDLRRSGTTLARWNMWTWTQHIYRQPYQCWRTDTITQHKGMNVFCQQLSMYPLLMISCLENVFFCLENELACSMIHHDASVNSDYRIAVALSSNTC